MVYWGDVNFKEIMKANGEMASDARFNPHFNGVVDHRRSNIKLTHEELQEIAKTVSDNDVSVGRWVILVESPMQTAFSMLYKENIEDQHPANIYSTIKSASAYLDFDLTEHLAKGNND